MFRKKAEANTRRLILRPRPTLRRRTKLVLRALGFRPILARNPLIPSLDRILPVVSHLQVGGSEVYYLPPGYQSRTEEAYFDDLKEWDEYQKEVYEIARMAGDRGTCQTVCDVGCG